jgi:glycosyltransferase involved in cell wall biosynthesis
VLFGAHRVDDARKGYRQLQDALYMLSHHKSVELVSFGEGTMPHQNALPVHAMGRIDDERVLALLYSAVDVFCAPSLYDNLPNTAIEAQACATPVVAFAVGGMSDIVQHEQTGYLAQPNDTADFSHGIAWVLEDQTRQDMLGNVARAKAVEQFSPERVARLHLDLYQRLPE